MKSLLLAMVCAAALAEPLEDTSMMLQMQGQETTLEQSYAGSAYTRPGDVPSMDKCWHWLADKFFDCLAWDDEEGDDNFVGKVLNPAVGEQTYGSGGSLSMDVSALTMAGIVGLSSGERAKFRTDQSIEAWRIKDKAPCRGQVKDRDVTASCCNDVSFALASFPRLNHVGMIVEAKKPGSENGYAYYVFDPAFNRFSEKATERRKVRILMKELPLANAEVKTVSGGMESKGGKFSGYASYDNFKQYFISMQTFFDNTGDLRYPLNGTEAQYRTFKSEPDPTVCFGHGPVLQKAGQKWLNSTAY